VSLLPCPFCGGAPEEWSDAAMVECVSCGAEMHGDSPEDAVKKWNTRTSEQTPTNEV
jgi:Lar family restriction alleviation protein